MTDASLLSDLRPFAPALLQRGADLNVKIDSHAQIIAKFCDSSKQHFANPPRNDADMEKKPVNQVLAEALKSFMQPKWTGLALAKASGVGEGTIRNYLSPGKRAMGTSGKPPSAKLSELELIATALGVTIADLVTDATESERKAIHRKRAGEFYERHGHLPAWAPEGAVPPEIKRPAEVPEELREIWQHLPPAARANLVREGRALLPATNVPVSL